MQAYSVDLRAKILSVCDQQFGSQRAIATLCGVSQSCVEKLLRRRRTSGDIAPRPHAGGRHASGHEAARGLLRRLIREHPEATWAELCAHLAAQRGLLVRVPTMSRLAKPWGRPRKQNHSTRARRTPRASSSKRGPTIAR